MDCLIVAAQREEELAPRGPRAGVGGVPLQRGVVTLQGVLVGARLLLDLPAAVPEARVVVIQREGPVKAAEGAVVLLDRFVHGGLACPRIDTVRGDPEGSVERMERLVRLVPPGVRLRPPDPRVRVLRREPEELLVVLRVVGRERGDLVVGRDGLLLLAGRGGRVATVRPESRNLRRGPQGPFQGSERVFRLTARELE